MDELIQPKLNGLVLNLDENEYHSRFEISKHGLDLVHKCPALFHYSRTAPKEPPTPAMAFGSLAHKVIMEGNEDAFYVMPKLDRRTKEGKAEYEHHQTQAAGKQIVSPDEWQQVTAMRDAVHNHSAKKLFDDLRCVEASVFWEDEDTLMDCRGRLDGLLHDGTIIDYKTTDDASPKAFLRTVCNFRYHVQGAFYLDGLRTIGEKAKKFMLIAQEKKPPYLVAVYILPPEFVLAGRNEYKADLEVYAKCARWGGWPGYNFWTELEMPNWMKQND